VNALQELESLGLRVGWQTALVGWNGPGANEQQVNGHQIVELAVTKLSKSPELHGEAVELASLEGHETEDIDRLLRRLASHERSSEDHELRKWRILLLQRVLDELPEDPLYAWTTLGEFWHSFGQPRDCPEIIHSFAKLPATNRYTALTRQKLLTNHQAWLATERSSVAAAEAA
jgi:Uncharacterized protein conserved in bacteria (DUF2247)